RGSGSQRGARDTPPRNAASRAISKLVGVEVRQLAGRTLSPGLRREPAQGVLRGRKLPCPVFFVTKFLEQPLGDPILFVGRQRRKLRDRSIQGAGNWKQYIPTLRCADAMKAERMLRHRCFRTW